jgi:hypothetical protein
MNRITPQIVQEAYEAIGAVPKRVCYVNFQAGQTCACGLSAVAIHRGKVSHGDILSAVDEYTSGESDISPVELLAGALDLSLSYANSFISGFDCVDLIADGSLGFADGKACAEAVFGYSISKE